MGHALLFSRSWGSAHDEVIAGSPSLRPPLFLLVDGIRNVGSDKTVNLRKQL
jgi:hypothetical protein